MSNTKIFRLKPSHRNGKSSRLSSLPGETQFSNFLVLEKSVQLIYLLPNT